MIFSPVDDAASAALVLVSAALPCTASSGLAISPHGLGVSSDQVAECLRGGIAVFTRKPEREWRAKRFDWIVSNRAMVASNATGELPRCNMSVKRWRVEAAHGLAGCVVSKRVAVMRQKWPA